MSGSSTLCVAESLLPHTSCPPSPHTGATGSSSLPPIPSSSPAQIIMPSMSTNCMLTWILTSGLHLRPAPLRTICAQSTLSGSVIPPFTSAVTSCPCASTRIHMRIALTEPCNSVLINSMLCVSCLWVHSYILRSTALTTAVSLATSTNATTPAPRRNADTLFAFCTSTLVPAIASILGSNKSSFTLASTSLALTFLYSHASSLDIMCCTAFHTSRCLQCTLSISSSLSPTVSTALTTKVLSSVSMYSHFSSSSNRCHLFGPCGANSALSAAA